MLREGFHQDGVHTGVAPYKPNSLDGGCPFFAGADDHAFADVPVRVAESTKVRASPASFADHYSQVRLFWASMSPVEKEHIIRAYSFELGKCYEQAVKERQLQALANIDPVLCAEVATALGLPAPGPTESLTPAEPSPALSQVGGEWPPDGRMIGIVVDEGSDLGAVRELRASIFAAVAVPLLIAPHGGMIEDLPVQRTFSTGRSVEYDVLLLAATPEPAPDALPARESEAAGSSASSVDPRVLLMIEECWRHAKVIGAWGDGIRALAQSGVEGSPGVVIGDSAGSVFEQVQQLMAAHRVWERFPATVA
jgi:catalase